LDLSPQALARVAYAIYLSYVTPFGESKAHVAAELAKQQAAQPTGVKPDEWGTTPEAQAAMMGIDEF
jgi:uncharacterized protein YciW